MTEDEITENIRRGLADVRAGRLMPFRWLEHPTPVRQFVTRAIHNYDPRFLHRALETFDTFREAHAAVGGKVCDHCPAVGACVEPGDHVMCIVCGTWWRFETNAGSAVVAVEVAPAAVARASRAATDPYELLAAMRRAEEDMHG